MASPILLALVLLALAATAADARAHPSSGADLPPENQKDLLAATLANLGYHELATAVQSLQAPVPSPVTVFAPSDNTSRLLQYSPALLSLHLVPGLLSASDLARLPSGSKLDLGGRRRCLTINSAAAAAGSKIFVHGVEITHPDLFNDGRRIAIHGLRSVVSALSPLSFVSDTLSSSKVLREAIPVLQSGQYGAIVLEMDGLGRDLALLHNSTLFVLEGQFIFACDVEFYIVPDRLLTHAELMQLPEGTVLPTLTGGVRRLTVTRSGAAGAELLQINGVSIKTPDIFRNAKIAVHGIAEPFSAAPTRPSDRVTFYILLFWLLFIVYSLLIVIKIHRILDLVQNCLMWCRRNYSGSERIIDFFRFDI